MRARIERLARFDEPLLIVGETGTGKELVARAVHRASARAGRPLQVVHCAGVGHDVLAAELFGHAAGAFTGATRDRPGRLRAADRSTVVLDEITETRDGFQAALLRAIEYGEIQPVGHDVPLQVDVRYLATTNRPLEELADGKGLRRDLFHRLAAFVIVMPTLAEHAEDIPELALHFVERLEARYELGHTLSASALDLLAAQHYPGNVRQLQQVITRAYAEADAAEILAEDVAVALALDSERERDETGSPVSLERVVRRHIRETLQIAEGNLSRAARLLEIPRTTLQHYLVKYRVEPAGRTTAQRKTAT